METQRFILSVLLQVEVEAYDENDAKDAVHDSFGEGSICGMEIKDYEVTDFESLG